MERFELRPSELKGRLVVPPSKSHTMRAILFAALSSGASRIERWLRSPDTEAMLEAVQLLGAQVRVGETLEITGGLRAAEDVIDCGNSGIVLRFCGALAGLLPHYTMLTGDASIRTRRCVAPLLSGLEQLGAFAVSSRGNGRPPLLIRGPLTGRRARIEGQDSQPVSGLLIAGALAPHPIELFVDTPGELPWIDMTLDWFDRLSIPYRREGYSYFALEGNAQISPFSFAVPGDFSTAAFPIGATLVCGTEVALENLDPADCQGDKELLEILAAMGARFAWERGALIVKGGGTLRGMEIDVNRCIDALPILATLACFARGSTRLVNAHIARHKESDRIAAMACELGKMGARVSELPDGLEIQGGPLLGAAVEAHGDHRVALALSVAALGAKGTSTLSGASCIAKTYPDFYRDFRNMGAQIDAF